MQKQELSLVHEILEPQIKSEKPPLLVMLHGYGSHENDLLSMGPMLNKEFFIVSARAPITLGFGGFAWYEINFNNVGEKMSDIPQAKDSLQKIQTFIDEVHQAYGTDPEQTHLMGFSQGCILSYALALNKPAAFKTVLALSGYVLKDLVPSTYKKEDLKNLEFFVSHGTMDEVLPVQWARQSVNMLEQLKVAHQYREYPMGHGVNPDCFNDLKKWLVDRDLA